MHCRGTRISPSAMRGTQYASSRSSRTTLVMTTRVHSARGSTWQTGHAIYKGVVVLLLATAISAVVIVYVGNLGGQPTDASGGQSKPYDVVQQAEKMPGSTSATSSLTANLATSSRASVTTTTDIDDELPRTAVVPTVPPRERLKSLRDFISDRDTLAIVEGELSKDALLRVLHDKALPIKHEDGRVLTTFEMDKVYQTITHACAEWTRRRLAHQQGYTMSQEIQNEMVKNDILMTILPSLPQHIADGSIGLSVAHDRAGRDYDSGTISGISTFLMKPKPDTYSFLLRQGSWAVKLDIPTSAIDKDLLRRQEDIINNFGGKKMK